MTNVLVLYYSAYWHIEAMANAVAEGAREAGAEVDIKRAPELVPEEIALRAHHKLDQATPVAQVEDFANYDAIIVGAGTTITGSDGSRWPTANELQGARYQGRKIAETGKCFHR